jgi:hypothetical protein
LNQRCASAHGLKLANERLLPRNSSGTEVSETVQTIIHIVVMNRK